MKKRLKKALWLLSQRVLNAGGDSVWKYLHTGAGSILMFHRVCPDDARPRLGKYTRTLEITPEIFEDIVIGLRGKGFRIVSLDAMVENLRRGRKGKRLVVLTFDDGYADIHRHVHPIAEKHGVPYCVYVTTCFPDRTSHFWWYQLEDLLVRESSIKVELGDVEKTWQTDSERGKSRAYAELAGLMIQSTPEQAASIMQSMYRNVGEQPKTYEDEGLSWEQLHELSDSPLVTVGGHTSNHVGLGHLPEEKARCEILEDKQRLESECGVPVRHFCYPFGTSEVAGQRECDLVRECGYESATTTNNGNIFLAHRDHLFCLPRISVPAGCDYSGLDSLLLRMDGRALCKQHPFKRVVTLDAYNEGLG